MAEAFTHGAVPDWASVLPAPRIPHLDLPTYPFQHHNYWVTPAQRDSGPDLDSEFWDFVHRANLADKPLSAVIPEISAWRREKRDNAVIDSWRYRLVWQPLPETSADRLTGTWLVIVPTACLDNALVQAVRAALVGDGVRVLVVNSANNLGEIADIRGMISLLALDERPHPDHPAVPVGAAATLELAQALSSSGIGAPLWHVTCGAVSIGPEDSLANPIQALVWGQARVIAVEHPEWWGGMIDLPETIDDRGIDRLRAVLAGMDHENEVAIRAGHAYGRRMVRAPLRVDEVARHWKPRGTTLITGGTGALGSRVARWLAANGAEHLVLVSRRGQGADQLRRELMELGTEVTTAVCDVSDRAALAAVIDAIPADRPLTAVVHTAAVLDDAVTESLSIEKLEHALRSKVSGAINLHELTNGMDLSAFVLFSSLAGCLGLPGQGNYAPGNAYLDALAQYRRSRGQVATSVAWGHWEGGGLATGEILDLLSRRGATDMRPELTLAALQRVLDCDETFIVVADMRWENIVSDAAAVQRLPLIRDLPEVQAAVAGRDPEGSDLRERLSQASESDRHHVLVELVRTHVATVLGYDSPDMIEPRRAFRDLGFDSLTGVELRNRLNAATGLRTPATLVFDHPTPDQLATHLRNQLAGIVEPVPTPVTETSSDPIVVVAMAGRFPGGVTSPEDLWELLSSGADAVGGFPTDRGWRLPDQAQYAPQGGFLSDVAGFDADFFGISPREALAMDPQQRQLLEVSWELLERAGMDPLSLRGSRTGVFVGSNNVDYAALLATGSEETAGYMSTGATASVLSGRVSYVFGFEGPAVTVDTACSSSLVAL
ncbi:type I polyketide synthase, partial [Goodfellowiella coeruleoviolacea]|uniref:type I polyketide synthase n=1 Tax=Goodfellowiella coeruleoviolacea TaxID=334858 RepID=UPI0027DF6AAC